ncbi:MAG: DVU_1553 family AMP-dependent CoA ligase [Velocimicrobium sp.]
MKVTPLENWILNRTCITIKSKEALREYQLSQLIKTLKYAKQKSRYYKKAFEQLDINSIKSMKDVAKIPFTLPEDIKKNPLDFLCVSQKEVKRIITINTSGTSGDEKRIYFTENDLNATIDFFQYGMSCFTDEDDRVLVLLPGKAYGSIGDLLKKALTLSNVECFIYGVLTNPEEAIRCIEENKITCIVGIPMQVLYLSRTNGDIFQRYIKKVLLSTDYVPDVLVKELNNRFHCDVYNHYGMSEMGYGGGVECEARNGYHVREGDLYFEIIDPKTGELVKDGQYGEIVFTTFHRQAMPLIRYRTGDIARFSTNPCTCGTFLRTMDKVTERISNKVVLKNNNEIHLSTLDEMIVPFREIVDYKASLFDNDKLSIVLMMNNSTEFIRLKKEITIRIKERFPFAINLEIRWQQADGIPKITNSMIKRKIDDFRKGEK